MTNAELLAKIKDEIERLKGQLIRGACAAQIEMETNCKEEAYDEILSFLSTLESEKPMNQDEELEEEIDRFEDWMETYNQADYPTSFTTRDIARHFAKWQKEQDEISKVNYEGARAVYDNTVQHLQEKIDEKYELGKKDMKEQMLHDAVEGEVYKFGEVAYVKERNNAELTKYLSQFNNRDRVKIIVIHETDIR